MTVNHDQPTAVRCSSTGRFIAILAIFALLGPLLGAIGVNALFTLLAVAAEVARGEFGDLDRLIVGGMVMGTIFSALIAYALGMPSAVGAGLVMAWQDRRAGKVSWKTGLLTALAFWAVYALVAVVTVPPAGRLAWIAGLLAAHIIATIACLWVVKRCFR